MKYLNTVFFALKVIVFVVALYIVCVPLLLGLITLGGVVFIMSSVFNFVEKLV